MIKHIKMEKKIEKENYHKDQNFQTFVENGLIL